MYITHDILYNNRNPSGDLANKCDNLVNERGTTNHRPQKNRNRNTKNVKGKRKRTSIRRWCHPYTLHKLKTIYHNVHPATAPLVRRSVLLPRAVLLLVVVPGARGPVPRGAGGGVVPEPRRRHLAAGRRGRRRRRLEDEVPVSDRRRRRRRRRLRGGLRAVPGTVPGR